MAQRTVAVVIGAGGIGLAVARRVANGHRLLLADYSPAALEAAIKDLRMSGFDVEPHIIDVAKPESVAALAAAAATAGRVDVLVHTAGVSPAQAGAERILEVNLVGTAHVLDAFYEVAAGPGTAAVCIASMAAHLRAANLPREFEDHLGTAKADRLLAHPEVQAAAADSATTAYSVAKRGNILRVQAAAKAWGSKGARVNAVSPGVISTAMGLADLAGENAAVMERLVQMSPAERLGTPEDVANVVEFLVSPASSFISGNDVLVDGGAVSGRRWAEHK